MSYRRSDIKYRRNEAFVDVIENVNYLMSATGNPPSIPVPLFQYQKYHPPSPTVTPASLHPSVDPTALLLLPVLY
jgi:hypothetical protein